MGQTGINQATHVIQATILFKRIKARLAVGIDLCHVMDEHRLHKCVTRPEMILNGGGVLCPAASPIRRSAIPAAKFCKSFSAAMTMAS